MPKLEIYKKFKTVFEYEKYLDFKNKIINRGVSDEFIEHGTVKQLLEITKLDPLSLTQLFTEINHE